MNTTNKAFLQGHFQSTIGPIPFSESCTKPPAFKAGLPILTQIFRSPSPSRRMPIAASPSSRCLKTCCPTPRRFAAEWRKMPAPIAPTPTASCRASAATASGLFNSCPRTSPSRKRTRIQAHQLFGEQLPTLLAELNSVLAA